MDRHTDRLVNNPDSRHTRSF